MAKFVLWVEGVNFNETVYDTNDLSTVRGGSLALLDTLAHDELINVLNAFSGITSVERLFSGASMALFTLIATDESRAADAADKLIERLGSGPIAADLDQGNLGIPCHVLDFVVGVAPLTADEAASVRLAHARARRAQMRGQFRRSPKSVATQVCVLSGSRSGDAVYPFNPAQAAALNIKGPTSHDGRVWGPVSRSVLLRKIYGRAQKQDLKNHETGLLASAPKDTFYDRLFKDLMDRLRALPALSGRPGALMAHDLHQMVEGKSEAWRLPIALSGKMAVFYADGNGFTKIRNEMGGDPKALYHFAVQARGIMEKDILGPVLKRLVELAESPDDTVRRRSLFPGNGDFEAALRFETLLFGGDEFCFVAPVWLGLELAELIMRNLKGKAFAHPDATKDRTWSATFKAGLIFCNHKMPIAVARGLAKDLAEHVASGSENRIGVLAFESVEPPAGGLEGHLARLIGDEKGDLIKLDGDAFPGLVERMAEIKQSGALPTSQIYRILRTMQFGKAKNKCGEEIPIPEGGRKAADHAASLIAEALVSEYFAKTSGDHTESEQDKVRELLVGQPQAMGVHLWLLAHLWDYVDPFEEGSKA